MKQLKVEVQDALAGDPELTKRLYDKIDAAEGRMLETA